jgi:hypothetical protein
MTDRTYADEIRNRLAALLDVDELFAVDGSMSALRALHALIVMEGDLDKLTPLQLDGFAWLLGHAELDNGLTWCGRWHVDNGLDARCERLAQVAAIQNELARDELAQGQPNPPASAEPSSPTPRFA